MNKLDEKKEYETPKMTVVEIKQSGVLLCESCLVEGYVNFEDGEAE